MYRILCLVVVDVQDTLSCGCRCTALSDFVVLRVDDCAVMAELVVWMEGTIFQFFSPSVFR